LVIIACCDLSYLTISVVTGYAVDVAAVVSSTLADESTGTKPALVSCEKEESTTKHGLLPDFTATSLSNAALSDPIIGNVKSSWTWFEHCLWLQYNQNVTTRLTFV
jgi:hypothetical protein